MGLSLRDSETVKEMVLEEKVRMAKIMYKDGFKKEAIIKYWGLSKSNFLEVEQN